MAITYNQNADIPVPLFQVSSLPQIIQYIPTSGNKCGFLHNCYELFKSLFSFRSKILVNPRLTKPFCNTSYQGGWLPPPCELENEPPPIHIIGTIIQLGGLLFLYIPK